MRVLVAALIAFALVFPASAAKQKAEKKPAPACLPLAPLMERLKASGFEYEVVTDGIAVLRITAIVKKNADKPFPMPTSLVIAFVGEEAKIGIVVGDKLCAVVTGPASGVRAMLGAMLGAVHGISIRQEGTGI